MTYALAIGLLLIAEAGTATLAIFIFRSAWKSDSFFRRLAQNIFLAFFTILFTLTAIEIAFKLFFIQSDGSNVTLASRSWFERYWRPINTLGFRDYEWTSEKIGNRKRIVVIGDSFVTGGGIANIEDRFSSQLGKKLEDNYAVMIVAQNGWNTPQEIEALRALPYPPDIVIFSYYINDIEGIASTMGFSRPPNLLVYPPNSIRPLVDRSYALNFAYWRIFRWQAFAGPRQRRDIQSYQSYLRALYENPEVWTAHQKELLQFYNLAQTSQHQLIVVAFSDMLRVEETRDLSGKAVDFFKGKGVPVIDVAALIATRRPKSTIANPFDTHPSVQVHTLVAEALYPLVLELEKK